MSCPTGHLSKKAVLALQPWGSVHIPGAQPHCCDGSWQSVHPAGSPWHRQTPERPFLQIQCPHYSHPTSSPRLGSPGGGCCTHRWQLIPLHRNVSLRRPLQRKQWHGQRLTPWWLQRKEIKGYGGQVRRAAGQKAGIQKPGLRKENSILTGSHHCAAGDLL